MADFREVRFTSRMEAPHVNLVRGMNADQVRVVTRLSADEVNPAGGINAESVHAINPDDVPFDFQRYLP